MTTDRSHAAAPTPLGPSDALVAAVRRRWPREVGVAGVRVVPDDRRAVADLGEAVARVHLERAGHVVVDRNWRAPDGRPRGEVDLVTVDDGCLVVVEVKARRGGGQGPPAAAVTRRKQQQLRGLALAWLRAHPRRDGARRDGRLRFDVVAVRFLPGGHVELDHLRGAF